MTKKSRSLINPSSFLNRENIDSRAVCFHVLLVNAALTLIKFVTGILGNSSVLVADAIHSLSDVLTTGGILWALKLSHKPPDWEHPYGHGKIESIASKLVALLLIAAGIGIIISVYHQISRGVLVIPHEIAIGGALISLVAKELSYQYMNYMAKRINSTVLVADAWHHRSDALSSLVALVGILGARWGFPILDPLLAGVVSFLIIWVGCKLLRSAVEELMDTIPDKDIIEQIRAAGERVGGVEKARNIKIRRYGSTQVVDLVIAVDGRLTVEEGHSLAISVKENIKNQVNGIDEVFIHVSPNVEPPAHSH